MLTQRSDSKCVSCWQDEEEAKAIAVKNLAHVAAESPVNACKPCSLSDKRECANCGAGTDDRSDLSLKACSRCKLVYYCSEPCQRQHWKEGEHKRFCVAVDDRKVIKAGIDTGSTQAIETTPSIGRNLKE